MFSDKKKVIDLLNETKLYNKELNKKISKIQFNLEENIDHIPLYQMIYCLEDLNYWINKMLKEL